MSKDTNDDKPKFNHNWNDYTYNGDAETPYDIDGPVAPEWIDEPSQSRPIEKRSRAIIKPMSYYKPTQVRWLEPGRIAMGKLTLIAGDPGLGKSFMTLELASRISRGEIGRQHNGLTGRSLILSAEDDACDTLAPRLKAMCARMNYVHFIEGMRSATSEHVDLPALDKDTDLLIDAIKEMGDVALVVIDPISAYMGRADSHNNAEVRCVLAQLSKLAQVTGAAVVCVTHLNKDSSGKRAVYRAMGSLAFTAAARTVHLVTKHPGKHEQDAPKRVVSMVKNNLGPILNARVYVIDDGMLAWLDEEIGGDADGFDGFDGEGGSFEMRQTQGDHAMEFLERILDAGPVRATDVFERGAALGLSETTLKRARDAVGAVSYKNGKVWYWSRTGCDESVLIRDAIEPELGDPPFGEFGTY